MDLQLLSVSKETFNMLLREGGGGGERERGGKGEGERARTHARACLYLERARVRVLVHVCACLLFFVVKKRETTTHSMARSVLVPSLAVSLCGSRAFIKTINN